MGTAVETAACNWLRNYGFPNTERLALAGAADRGDLRLQLDPVVIAECKRAQLGLKLTPWMKELEVEIANAGAVTGLLIAKQKGAGNRSVHRWVSAMSHEHLLHVLNGCRVMHGVPPWVRIEKYSPMLINSAYIPDRLSADIGIAPFAETYQPGHPERKFVIGPLRQMTALLRAAGFGDRAVAGEEVT